VAVGLVGYSFADFLNQIVKNKTTGRKKMLKIKQGGIRLAQAGLVSAAVIAFAGSAVGANFTPELQDLIKKAGAEGKLHVAWSQSTLDGAAGALKIEAGMNKMFGTNIKISFSPGRSMAAMSGKVRAEVAAGQPATSDSYLGSSPFVVPLIKRKVLVAFPYAKMLPGRITPAMVVGDGVAVRFATGFGGVTYNTNLAPYKPTKITDFLKPEWKGKISSTPYAASFDTLTAKGVWGPEKTEDYVRKLAKNIRGLIRCGEGERIATGEIIALVMDCHGRESRVWAAKGAPIAQVLFPEAAIKRQFYLGVPKNSTNKNAAALFAVFLLTKEGQKIVRESWLLDSDLFPESNAAKRTADLEKLGAKFAEGSVAFVNAHPEINKLKKKLVKILKSAK
jgi:ABC-type Fe3+ transport system substrate-binding protein